MAFKNYLSRRGEVFSIGSKEYSLRKNKHYQLLEFLGSIPPGPHPIQFVLTTSYFFKSFIDWPGG